MIEVALLATVLGVLTTLLARRRGLLTPVPVHGERPRWLETVLALGFLLVVNAKLVNVLLRGPFLPSGDLASHAIVAREIALGHAHGGYIDHYLGGFPIGPHYPMVGWSLSVPLIWLGMPATVAAFRVGMAAVLLFNLLVYVLSRRAGASAGAALAGACLVSVISPATGFMGGAQALLALGLLSQVVAMPATLLLAYAVVFGRSVRGLAFSSALVVLAHPQVAVAASMLLACAAAVRGQLAVRRWCFALLVQALIGGAVFGPGLASLKVPFGWPPMRDWSILGRPATWLLPRLWSGDALDFARTPVVTVAVACSLVVLVALSARREARGALLLATAAVLLCISGRALDRAGAIGALLLSFLQPLRAYSLLPAVAAAVVVVATHGAEAVLRSRRWLALAVPGLAVTWLTTAPPADAWSEWARLERRLTTAECVEAGKPALGALIANAREGRLYYDRDDVPCHINAVGEFASRVPIAWPVVVGAHVGVLWEAMQQLEPTRDDAAERADVLGIGTIVHLASKAPQPASSFRERGRAGSLVVSERVPGASYFGLGCVVQRWRGPDATLRTALLDALSAHAPELWSKARFVALESSRSTPFEKTELTSSCDATRAELVASQRVAPGHYVASVRAAAPVDLVLKETAHATWQIRVDGEPQPFRAVAPGFMAIHLEPGPHQVDARVAWDVRYWLGVIAALLLTAALTERARRARWRLARETDQPVGTCAPARRHSC